MAWQQKSLPQEDVATVEVMKHHQPIRVLDDFTYSDDNAINIKMKQGAKARWMTTYSGGIRTKASWRIIGIMKPLPCA